MPFSADAELSAAGSGSAPISTPAEEDAVEESVADELTPPEKQTFGEDDDTSAFLVKAAQELSGIIGSQPGLLYMDDGWIKASLHFPNDKSFANFNIDRKGPGFQAVSAANGPQGFATLRYYNDNISRLILELEGDGSGDVEMRDTAYFARDRFTIGDTDFVGMRVDETGQGTLFGNSTRDNMFSAAPFYLGNTQVIPQIIVGGSDLFVSNLDTVLGIVSVEAFSSSGDKLLGEEVSLDPKETKQFEVPGPFGAGYVLLRSPLEFASQIRWNTKALLDIPDVGMPGEKGGSSWNFIAFNDSKIRTGVAMANPGGQKDCVATYDDKEHEILFRVDFTLGLGRSLPIFLEELLPGLADAGDTTGLFGVSCTGMDLNPTDDLIPAGAGRAPSGDDLFSATAVTQERESNAIVATPGFPADILGFSKIIRILTPDDPL